jgi:sporulation protein YlmC with PRC-barrel domain
VELVRDLLDNQVIDRRGLRIGKVDGVLLSVVDGRAPRVIAIELGVTTLAHRLHPRIGRWLERTIRRHRMRLLERTRIPWSRVARVGIDLRVDLDGERTRAHVGERWLRTHLVARIPGSR